MDIQQNIFQQRKLKCYSLEVNGFLKCVHPDKNIFLDISYMWIYTEKYRKNVKYFVSHIK